MILYQRDWLRFPTAIVDTKTKNHSFIRLAQLYKSMGIKNHTFMLALIQPELQGVDPHSPTLTQEQKIKIGMECRWNPWYYFREVARLPPQAGAEPVQFLANRGNIALYWSFFNNIDSALIQPRQTGKSASTDVLMDWLIYIGATNSKIMMITKDDSLRKANVERLKGIRDYLPKYLVTITTRDADNQNELTCKALGNSYSTGVAQNSEAAANNLGRGLTTPILHLDEGPFINFVGTSLPAALAAGTAARAEAARNNRPYGNIFTTTAGKKDDRDGRFMYDMIHGGAVWNEIFFDAKDKEELKLLVIQNCTGRKSLVNITMSHRQLGYTDQWLYEAIAATASDGEAADRDFLNVWTSGTRRSPLSVQVNETIRNSEIDVQHSAISAERFILRWYIPEEYIEEYMASGSFVIGLDTSDAVGRDEIGLVMIDVRDLSTVAVGVYNETNLIRFGEYLAQLLIKYPTTTLVPERKSSAPTLIDYLALRLAAAGYDPFKRIFNKIADEFRENEDAYREICRVGLNARSDSFYETRKKYVGFNTNADNRTLMYTTVLQNSAKKAGHLVRDKSLSEQLRGLVEKNGRIDHAASGHDDLVIAWLLAHWFLTHGRNLSHYGINHADVMSRVSELGRTMTDEEEEDKELQNQLLDEVDTILTELKTTRDELMVMKLEHRLRVLGTRIKSEELSGGMSIDAMIQSSNEERLKRQRMDAQQQRRQQMTREAPWNNRMQQHRDYRTGRNVSVTHVNY